MSLSKLKIIEIKPKEEKNEDLLNDLIEILYQNEEELDKPLPIIPKNRILLNLKLFNKASHYWRYFILKLEAETVGFIKHSINLERDNHMSSIHLFIQPKHRQKGFAKFLLNHIIPSLPENITVLEFMQRGESDKSPIPLNDLFTRLKGKLTYLEGVNVSDISHFDPSQIHQKSAELINNAQKRRYELKFYINASFKDMDDFQLHDYVKMMEYINNDMPKEESSWEDEVWDEGRLMERYKTANEKREEFWAYIAIHKETKKPVGMTEVVIQEDFPTMVDQMETGVINGHRGHKLGLTLKYAILSKMLKDKKTRKMRYWKTENANSNSHMLAINEELGYKTLFYQCIYEIPRENVENWLEN